LLGRRQTASFSDPPMPAALSLAAKVFDVAVVALIFTAFS
jgi:hypothetical protein